MTQAPWSRALTREVDDAAIEAGWRNVRTRRARPRLARAPLAAVAVVAFAALLFFFVLRPHSQTPAPVVVRTFTLPQAFAENVTTLDDGSKIEVASSASLRTTSNDPTHVDLALERGRTTFDIVPGGPRAWKIDAGRVIVRVLGTRFTVDRHDRVVDVRVERGKVSVEGPDVPGGTRILLAGDSIHVEEPALTAMTPDALPTAPPATPAKKAAVLSEPDFMAQADAARREGRPRDAVALLSKLVAKKDPQAALAAFTLAKIEAEDLGDAAAAATWFERAASLGLPSGLDEEALARAVESSAKAGRRADATRLAHRYEAKFPNGRHLERVRSWSSP